MQNADTLLLILHIVSGSVALLAGTITLSRRKGDASHRMTGKVFSYAMLATGISALVLSMLRPNHFLLIIGIFTLYMTGTGHRYIQLRDPRRKPNLFDWLLSVAMGITALVFLVWGVRLILAGSLFGIVYIVFGTIGGLFARADWINYKGKAGEINFWQTAHLQRMTGAYIASLTAFLVVNDQIFPAFFPSWLFWILPTLVLTPLIVSWSRKYGIRKSP